METAIYKQTDSHVPTTTDLKSAQALQNTGLMPYFYHYYSTEIHSVVHVQV